MRPVAPREALLRHLNGIQGELLALEGGGKAAKAPPAVVAPQPCAPKRSIKAAPLPQVIEARRRQAERRLVRALTWAAVVVFATLFVVALVAHAEDSRANGPVGTEPVWSVARDDLVCSEAPVDVATLACTQAELTTSAQLSIPPRASKPERPARPVGRPAETHAHPDSPTSWSTSSNALLVILLLALGVARRRRAPPEKPRLSVAERSPATPSGVAGAVATHPGSVRRRNEDAVRLVTVSGALAVVVADGLGGHPDGARASRYAVERAAAFLERRLASAATHSELVQTLLAETFARTARLHARAAQILGYSNENDGMRTTLAIAVATSDAFVCGMLGDGAVMHVDEAGVRELIAPQREAGGFVAGSLGALPSGVPAFSVVPRGKHPQAIVLATDGIGDIATADTYRQLARTAWSSGPANAAALLIECARRKVVGGAPVAVDNVSVGLLVTNGEPSCRKSVNV